jgi:hypothetical protein
MSLKASERSKISLMSDLTLGAFLGARPSMKLVVADRRSTDPHKTFDAKLRL